MRTLHSCVAAERELEGDPRGPKIWQSKLGLFVEANANASSNLQPRRWQPPGLKLDLELRHAECLRLGLGSDRHDVGGGSGGREGGREERGRELECL